MARGGEIIILNSNSSVFFAQLVRGDYKKSKSIIAVWGIRIYKKIS